MMTSYKMQPEINRGHPTTQTATPLPPKIPTFESKVESIKDTSVGDSAYRAADASSDVQF